MASSSIRVVAVDIDGTLTDPSFHVSERNIAALRAAHRAGVEIILATGRRHDYAMLVARELAIPVLLLSSNGALVRSSDGETLFAERLARSTARALIGHMDRFRGHAVLTFDRPGNVPANDSLVLERADQLNQSVSRWLELNRPYIRFVAPLETALMGEDPLQAMFCGRIAFMAEAEERLAQADFLDQITVMKTQYDHRDLCILDILTRDCSKGHALRRWAQLRGVAPEQIMAIGDNYNDVEMLEFAGLPVIMGNASEDLKQNGWKVTATNAESGVAVVVEELLRAGFQEPIQRQ
ncbi:MAG TPA: Cof-type HAD-IIB family hydrolase [Candidatus Angelobacter sp.]|nr:Cof-type HAD-IIB family hydrolase [Candidatus Angelobacter sp.]